MGDDRREDEYGEVLDPKATVRETKQMIAQYGFREIKLKGGVLDPDVEIETITRAARRSSARRIRCASIPTAPGRSKPRSASGERLKDELSGGGYLEDPCASLEGMAEVRRRLLAEGIDTPLASNVAVTYFADVPQGAQAGRSADRAVRSALLGRHAAGAIAVASVRRAGHGPVDALQQSPGRQPDGHDARGRGVAPISPTPATRIIPGRRRRTKWWPVGGFPFENGAVRIPDKPGLGVELDYDQLARGRERYAKLPYRKRDDEAEMRRHVDPNWKRVLPRW